MFRRILRTCLGGKVKFYFRTWNGYKIGLFHSENNIRFYPMISWIPYFWDSEIAFDLGIQTPKFRKIGDDWNYHWELRDLDENIVHQGKSPKRGDGVVTVTNKGFRRKLRVWNSGKHRAVVLGNLHPHREYLLYLKFTTSTGESDEFLMASLSVDDRSTWQMQVFMGMFLVLFAITITLFVRGCGIIV